MSQKFSAIGIVTVPAAKANDAIATLAADRNAATALYKKFETLCISAGTEDDMAAVERQICSQLSVHARFEEDLFYRAVREAIENDLLLKDAEIHDAVGAMGAGTPSGSRRMGKAAR